MSGWRVVISLMGPLAATRQPDRQGAVLRRRGPVRGLSGAGRSVYPGAGDGWPGQDGRWRPAPPPVPHVPHTSPTLPLHSRTSHTLPHTPAGPQA
jgi:hypothetical protein